MLGITNRKELVENLSTKNVEKSVLYLYFVESVEKLSPKNVEKLLTIWPLWKVWKTYPQIWWITLQVLFFIQVKRIQCGKCG